jgi:hypothetical protein
MCQDILLLLIPTPQVMQRMGLEHSIPISLMEIIRREVQVLILMRSLVHHIEALIPSKISAAPVARTSCSKFLIVMVLL